MADQSDNILFYDGDCGLCDRSIQWIMARDGNAALQFAPLGGTTYHSVLASEADALAKVDSVVFFEAGKVHLRSRAIAHVGKYLTRGRWVRLLRFVPRFLADLGYRAVAKVRYRVWGKRDACRIPSPQERARLLP